MTLTVTIVVGNPKAQSRTLGVATALAAELFDGREVETTVIDLAEYADEMFSWESERVNALNAQVASSDVAIFATPTYKASYTGLLKAFLDRYDTGGLAGVVAIPVHTGGSPAHSLAPTVALTPLLIELGAAVPGQGLYFVTGDMSALDGAVAAAAARLRANIAAVAELA